MKTRQAHYHYVATLPERSNNHPFARLVAVLDTKRGEFFAANTCDVHERLAPWDGGADSHYDHDEIHERLLMLQAGLADMMRDREKLAAIRKWCDAYPLEVFPEYDFKKAHEVLKANGMTLDAISASAMRHVLDGIRKIIDGDKT